MRTNTDTGDAAIGATVRIEHDRKRLLLRLLGAVAGLAATAAGLAVTLLHVGDVTVRPTGVAGLDANLPRYVATIPTWAPLALVPAVAIACVGLLRIVFRLQDGDPALVVSPRGVRFRPTLFGDIAQIPWSAIRAIKLRRYKQQRYIDFRIDGIDRYVAREGLRSRLLRLAQGGDAGVATLSSPMSREAWTRTGELLEAYLAAYGAGSAAVSERAATGSRPS